MSSYRFGCDDYHLNYDPPEASDGMGGTDWEKVESVEIEDIVFVRTPDCATCTERRGYYEDAETIQRQQERIAELETENERLRRAGYEIGYHDGMKRIADFEQLVRDMAKLNHCNIGGECAICTAPTLCDIPKRVRELRIDMEGGA